jgi:hypothetical protein
MSGAPVPVFIASNSFAKTVGPSFNQFTQIPGCVLLNSVTALFIPVTPDQNVRFTEPDEQPLLEAFATRCGVAAPNAALDVTNVAVMLVAATATSSFRNLTPRVVDGGCPEDLSFRERRIAIYCLLLYRSLP